MKPRQQARHWYATAKARGVHHLRAQRSGAQRQTFAGKSIVKVMHAYTTYAGNGDIHPSQAALAERAKVSKRTVELVQDWLIEQGWLVVTTPAVKGIRGPTVRLMLPPMEDTAEKEPDSKAPHATTTKTTQEKPKVSGQQSDSARPMPDARPATKCPIEQAKARAQIQHQEWREKAMAGHLPVGPAWVRVAESIVNDPGASERQRQDAQFTLDAARNYDALMASVPDFD